MELIFRSAGTAQAQAVQLQDAFEVREEHLDLFPFPARYNIGVGGRDIAGDVARAQKLEPLVKEAGVASLTELGERFVISHPKVSTMLVGYSTIQHLEEAIAAVQKGSLPSSVVQRISG